MLDKPQTKADLLPRFTRIGDSGWETEIRSLLLAYDVPLPAPATHDALMACEHRLGAHLPEPLTHFLRTFGPVNFDDPILLAPDQIQSLDHWGFRPSLSDGDQRHLRGKIQIAETGSDDIYGLDLTTGTCCRCVHYPAAIEDWLPSFDDFLRMALIDLSWSYYGWPDPAIERMATELKNDVFGARSW